MIFSDITMSKKKTYPLELEEDFHKELKIQAIQEDKSLKELMLDALENYLEEEKKN